MKIACLVPVFNLAIEDINKLLSDFPERLDPPLIIFNGDDAKTIQYLRQLAVAGRVRLLQNPLQLGKTEAIRQGLKLILQDPEVDMIAQCDGRSKQPIWQLPRLFAELRNTQSDMVVGDRYTGQSMDGQNHRKAGSGLMSIVVRSITAYNLPDAVCGMRVYTRGLATNFLNLRCFGYAVEAEQLVIASLNRCKVSSIPVKSSLQEDITNAEKIEDNVYVAVNYASELGIPDTIRDMFNHILAQIKRRSPFDVDLSALGGNGIIRLNYIGTDQSIVNAYTDQTIRDGYVASRR